MRIKRITSISVDNTTRRPELIELILDEQGYPIGVKHENPKVKVSVSYDDRTHEDL